MDKKIEEEGFSKVTVCPNGPNTEFPEHTHDVRTVHVLLKGELTIIDSRGESTFHEGERFEFSAGTTHRAKCGSTGCTFIVGVKKL